MLVFTAFFIALFQTVGSAGRSISLASAVVLGALEGAVLILALSARREAVITDETGLTVRTLFRRTYLPWQDVDRLMVRREGLIPGPVAYIGSKSSGAIRTALWSGGLGLGNRSTQRAIDALEADIARRTSG